jgi:ribulose-phosphate 3-epimerase
MKSMLAPSVLSADFAKLADAVKLVESAGADIVHLDVMDGHFVPNITIGPKMVRDIRKVTKLPLDVHLMITEPDKYIADFAEAGADLISVHYEAAVHLDRLIHHIKEHGCKAGVVINPATVIEVLDEVLNITDYILLMSVNPGFGGQKFIESSTAKARKLKEKITKTDSSAFIEMDGGIGLDNMKTLKDAGVDVFVCGHSIFGSKNPAKTIKEMKKILND